VWKIQPSTTQPEKIMQSSIYTNQGSLVVDQVIWSGVIRIIKQSDGTCERFYRIHGQPKFRKTGWGARAAKEFEALIRKVRDEIYGA
jgi:hypothetical protein